MIRFTLLLALAACGRSPPPASASSPITGLACSSPCSSNSECGDFFSGCKYCFSGHCSTTLPAAPIDGGIDADPTATH